MKQDELMMVSLWLSVIIIQVTQTFVHFYRVLSSIKRQRRHPLSPLSRLPFVLCTIEPTTGQPCDYYHHRPPPPSSTHRRRFIIILYCPRIPSPPTTINNWVGFALEFAFVRYPQLLSPALDSLFHPNPLAAVSASALGAWLSCRWRSNVLWYDWNSIYSWLLRNSPWMSWENWIFLKWFIPHIKPCHCPSPSHQRLLLKYLLLQRKMRNNFLMSSCCYCWDAILVPFIQLLGYL